MAKAKATHLDINSDPLFGGKPREILLRACPSGGFTVSPTKGDDYGRSSAGGAFTNLDEALAWLAVNMAQPAKDAA